MFKKISLLLMLVACCALCSCKKEGGAPGLAVPEVTGKFYVSILDIGKADAIILRTDSGAAIIDCGEKGDAEKIIACLSENNIEKVDYLFITHFDKDHVGGAAEVIKNMNIGRIITPDYEGTKDEYIDYIRAAEKKNIMPVRLNEKITFKLGDAQFEVFPPRKEFYNEEDNDYSLIISVTHGENKFLFAGDAEKERLSELSNQLELKHDFLKLPHHGLFTDNIEMFLVRVNPGYAAVTCGRDSPPSDKVLDILRALESKVYLTQDGNIEVISDGKTISVKQ